MPRLSHRRLVTVLFSAAYLFVVSPSEAPAADRDFNPRLLPRSTIAYLHVPDVPALMSAASQTSLGRLCREPDIERSLSYLQEQLFDRDDEIPQPIDDFPALVRQVVRSPIKQFTMALIQETDGQTSPVLVCAADRWELTPEATPNRVTAFTYFARDDYHVLCGSQNAANQLLEAWSGRTHKTLASDSVVSEAFRRESPSDRASSLAEWFVRPIPFLRHLTGDSSIAELSPQGLDEMGIGGIQALFGRLRCRTSDTDWEVDMALFVPPPRKGLSQCIALGAGSLAADMWIPADAASNTTILWDAAKSLDALRTTIATAKPEARFDWLSTPQRNSSSRPAMTGASPLITGKISLVSWWPESPKVGPLRRLTGITCRDSVAAQRFLQWYVDDGARRRTRAHLGYSYYLTNAAAHEDVAPPFSHNCYVALDSHVLLANCRAAMDEAIATYHGDRSRLADEPDFRLMKSRVEQVARDAGAQASALFFLRPDMHLAPWLTLAAPAHRETLKLLADDQLAWNEPLAAPWFELVDRGFVPPDIVTLRNHLAPVAGVAWDDGTALRWRLFVPARRPHPVNKQRPDGNSAH